MNQELNDYIQHQRSTGVSDDEIKKALLTNGWSSDQIQHFFSNSTPVPTTPRANRPILVAIVSLILLVIGVLSLIGSGLSFVFSLFTYKVALGGRLLILSGVVGLISSIADLYISSALFKMKKSGVHVLTIMTLIQLGLNSYSLANSGFIKTTDLVALVITTLITIYLWAIYERFN